MDTGRWCGGDGFRCMLAAKRCCRSWMQSQAQIVHTGQLERGIVPEECVWTQGDGVGEDGCLLLLRKMNLELMRRCVLCAS